MSDERANLRVSIGLTVFFAILVAGAVCLVMYALTFKLGLDHAYWLVPIFGALGGVIGGIRRNSALELCTIDGSDAKSPVIRLGFIGDVLFGLGGSGAASYLFSGTLDFSPSEQDSYVLAISLALVTGVFGRAFLERLASNFSQLQGRVDDLQVEVRETADHSLARAEFALAKALTQAGDLDDALDALDRALAADPRYFWAYAQKGYVLKRLSRLEHALQAVEEALKIKPDYAPALYNRACYRCLLQYPEGQVLDDLKKAIDLEPTTFKRQAKKDSEEEKDDLWRVSRLPEFQKLVG